MPFEHTNDPVHVSPIQTYDYAPAYRLFFVPLHSLGAMSCIAISSAARADDEFASVHILDHHGVKPPGK